MNYYSASEHIFAVRFCQQKILLTVIENEQPFIL